MKEFSINVSTKMKASKLFLPALTVVILMCYRIKDFFLDVKLETESN